MPTTGGLAKNVYAMGQAYKARKKRRVAGLQKQATALAPRVPKRPVPKQVGGGVAAPQPGVIKTPPRPRKAAPKPRKQRPYSARRR
jgi:hypothetical protein